MAEHDSSAKTHPSSAKRSKRLPPTADSETAAGWEQGASLRAGWLTAQRVLQLQRVHGNKFVTQLLRAHRESQPRAAATGVLQRLPLEYGSTVIETDQYSTHTLQQIWFGIADRWKGLKPTGEQKAKLKAEWTRREQQNQFNPILTGETEQHVKEQKYQLTLQKNLAARQLVHQVLLQGQQSNDDPILKNSCEVALTGGFKVFAITPLEENYDVLSALKRGAGKTSDTLEPEDIEDLEDYVILYPKGDSPTETGDVTSQDTPAYQHQDYTQVLNDPHVSVESRATKGWQKPGVISMVISGAATESSVKAYLYPTLKHEVQHALDDSIEEAQGLPPKSMDTLMDHALARFKTEYRAFFVMGHQYVQESLQENPNKPTKFVLNKSFTVTDLHNTLSYLAFEDMKDDYFYREDEEEQTERLLLPYKKVKKFGEIVATLNPLDDMINKTNSPRILAFYRALAGGNATTIEEKAGLLQKEEVVYLLTEGGQSRKITRLTKNVSGLHNQVIGWLTSKLQ